MYILINDIVADHLRDVDFDAEVAIGLADDDEALYSSDVQYEIGITFRMGKRVVTVYMESENTALTFPANLLGKALPEVFRHLAKKASLVMNEAVESAFNGGDKEKDDE